MAAILTNAGPIFTSHVPGEICCVCTLTKPLDGKTVYAAVGTWFNRLFRKLLAEAGPPNVGPLAADAYPKGLRHRYGSATDLLRPIRPTAGGPDPWFELERPRIQRTRELEPWRSLIRSDARAIGMYRFEFGDRVFGLPEHRDDVRELVNLANRSLVGNAKYGSPIDGCTLEAVSPNWLNSVLGNGGGGCPGAKPEPTGPGEYLFEFANGAVKELLGGSHDDSVTIVVLDTSPSHDEVKQAAGRYRDNRLFRDVVGPDLGTRLRVPHDGAAIVADDPSLSSAELNARLDRYVPAWYEQLKVRQDFDIRDHGLFVAGIVCDLARHADVRLVRVLNDWGVGDLMSIAHALRQVPGMVDRTKRPHLIVNMSLGADLAPGDEGFKEWLPATYGHLFACDRAEPLRANLEAALAAAAQPLGDDAARLMRLSLLNLALAVSWLVQEQGAMLVASAGNDYDKQKPAPPTTARQEPRFPARYADALGVAAVNVKGAPSEFANRGDVQQLVNGVATFGGDARRAAERTLPVIEPDQTPIVGIFSAKTVALGGGPNEHGWVRWAGSSFSAPIVSALAAKLWPTVGGPPSGVMTRLQSPLGTAPTGGQAADRIDCEVIRAWQTP
jgi:hypothetical protein